tara:strand:+ start:695 stop:1102 length:408 start_codon:yes stop_codon:yes gene_type:complete
MANLNINAQPKWIIFVDDAKDEMISIPIGFGQKVSIKQAASTAKVYIQVANAGYKGTQHAPHDVTDACITLTTDGAAGARQFIGEVTRWMASAGNLDSTNPNNTRVWTIIGDTNHKNPGLTADIKGTAIDWDTST